MPSRRLATSESPDQLGVHAGLAFALFQPTQAPLGSVVILHGSGSSKESHFDYARAARAQGLAAVCFDQRGHGESEGALDGRAVEDIVAISTLLPPGPLALRGSSMGGYLALISAGPAGARAVVAICPASGQGLRRSLRRGDLGFRADEEALDALFAAHDVREAVRKLEAALLLMHAEGDELVPVEHSRELLAAAGGPAKRLITVPGGHHRSVQHDPELQAHSLRFIARAFSEDPLLATEDGRTGGHSLRTHTFGVGPDPRTG